MSEYIAHLCPECSTMILIKDRETFTDMEHNPITTCPNCGKRLTIPRTMITWTYDDYSEFDNA